jgi:uncharacterized membrane protein YkvA (DUF1232 family)
MSKTSVTNEEANGALEEKEREAVELIKDEKKTMGMLDKAKDMLDRIKKLPVIGSLVDEIITTIDMIADYVKGNYKEVPFSVIVPALGAIIYLVSPIDLIPDPIPFFGFLDDAAVFTLVLGMGLHSELGKYREWVRHEEIKVVDNKF